MTDVLAIGAHPDDVELGIGGLIHKLARHGYHVVMADLTAGEMSTRGTVEERREEGLRAAAILGARERVTLDLPDGALANTTEQQRAVIPLIRRVRPRMLLAPMEADRHPDHVAAHALARDANYFSGLAKIDTGHAPYRVPRVYFYQPYFEDRRPPDFIVDVSADFDAKIAALKAHASQFHNPDYKGRETFIASKQFWDSIAVRAAYWGNRVGRRYGEPLCCDRTPLVTLPPGLEFTS